LQLAKPVAIDIVSRLTPNISGDFFQSSQSIYNGGVKKGAPDVYMKERVLKFARGA
jgi:hypothetical protein